LERRPFISSSTGIVEELVESKIDRLETQSGWLACFLFLGMIRMSANGLLDEHPRVRYEALTSLGLLLTSLAPDAQLKYHADFMTILLKM
jgi:hypothetical protein